MSRVDEEEAAAPGAVGDGGGGTRWRWVAEHQVVAGLLAGVVLLSSGAVAAWLTVRAPAPDVLTARVERRVLDGSVTTRGMVTAGQTVQVAASAGAGDGAVRAVVTKAPVRTGDMVAAGRLLVEISGRPVFALPGPIPAYRDLKPGSRGADVTQLQKALRSLGFRTGKDHAAVFGAGTSAALTAFYTARGYTPLPAQPDGATRLAAAEDAVAAARHARQDAKDALAAARARAGLASARVSAAARAVADQEVAAARRRVSHGDEDLAAARRRLSAAKTANGPMLPVAEVVYLQGFPATVDAAPAAVGSVVTGNAMTVSADGLVVRGGLPAYQKGLVRPGQTVRIVSEADRVSAGGTVVSVADTPVRLPAGPGQVADPVADPVAVADETRPYPIVVRPNHQLDPGLTAQEVLLTVQAPPSNGRVLAVPTSAITVDADGRTVVTAFRDGRGHPVEVLPGASGGGWTEIRPLGEDPLRVGDQVVVGRAGELGATPAPVASGPASAGRAPGLPAARTEPSAAPAAAPAAAPSAAAARPARPARAAGRGA
ncbi:RND family efflux transporter [Peterkaempfera bronchialis]|uniref:Peptidoglycan-binding protein n=1 Tax=Peterkaempfera bronchialis TaxID=2126346 RepID=A0A345SXG5_9ACTN|nr:peptidoglycan-binding protein [Peterkaempfera bronchialis]AXI78420.1 peptidoglycan-binding protein [Peterkaempfera bronchialis]